MGEKRDDQQVDIYEEPRCLKAVQREFQYSKSYTGAGQRGKVIGQNYALMTTKQKHS